MRPPRPPAKERRAGKRADDAGRHTGSIHAFPKSVPDCLFPKSADADGETGKVRRFPMAGFGTPGDLAEWPGLVEIGYHEHTESRTLAK